MPSDVNGTNGEGAGARTAATPVTGDATKKGPGPPSSGAAPLSLPSATDVEQLVRAQGSTFLVSDRSGDITPAGARELGLFHEDTRFLSHYTLDVGGGEVVRLSADTSHDGYNQIDLMLSDLDRGDILDDPKNFIHIRRRQMLDAGLVEQIVFTNFLQRRVALDVSITFGADFADIFEVRGARRPKRGTAHPPRVSEAGIVFTYDGLCGTRYESAVTFTTPPADVKGTSAHYEIVIAVLQSSVELVEITTDADGGNMNVQPQVISTTGLLDTWQSWTLQVNGIGRSATLTIGSAVVFTRALKDAPTLAILTHPQVYFGAATKNDGSDPEPACKVGVDDILVDIRSVSAAN